jgi:DNA invertase Pin-like site-specific DNA recombinase
VENKPKTKRYAVRYARWSRGEQKDGDSLRRQDREFQEFCRRHDLEPHPTYELPPDDGRSGFHSDNFINGSLNEFMLHVKDKSIEQGTVLVIERQDRFSRDDPWTAAGNFKQVLETGASIGICSTNNIYDHEDFVGKPMVPMMIYLEAMQAHEYSKALRARLLSAWSGKRERAKKEEICPEGKTVISKGEFMTAMRPHWLKAHGYTVKLPSGKDRFIVEGYNLVQDRVDAVKRIFELACQGHGCKVIADKLQAEGIKTAEGKPRWHPNFIIRIIQNRAVMGEFQPRMRVTRHKSVDVGEAIPGYYPKIIEAEVFNEANKLMGERKAEHPRTRGPSKQHRINIFKDILFDPEDRPFHISITYPREYRMLRSVYGRGGPNISYEMMERAFVQCINEIDPASVQEEKADDEIDRLIKKRDSLIRKLATIDARIKTEDDIGYLLDSKRDLTRQLDVTTKAREDAEMRRRNPVVESVRALKESRVADPTYYRARLRLAVRKMTLAVDELPLDGRKYKLGLVTVHFRGGYTKAYAFGYRNSRGYLAEPLPLSDCLRITGHDLTAWQGIIAKLPKLMFISDPLERALTAHIVGTKVPSEKEMAAWKAAADRGDLVPIE